MRVKNYISYVLPKQIPNLEHAEFVEKGEGLACCDSLEEEGCCFCVMLGGLGVEAERSSALEGAAGSDSKDGSSCGVSSAGVVTGGGCWTKSENENKC